MCVHDRSSGIRRRYVCGSVGRGFGGRSSGARRAGQASQARQSGQTYLENNGGTGQRSHGDDGRSFCIEFAEPDSSSVSTEHSGAGRQCTTGSTYAGGTVDYRHVAADVVFKWRGIAVQAEYVARTASADVISSTKADGTPLTEYTRSGRAWILQCSYTFPRPFEYVGRFSRLYADRGTDPTLVKELEARPYETGLGINYYFNDHRLKLQADWIARINDDFDYSKANHVVHVQVDATF